jgi:hypothetical protein
MDDSDGMEVIYYVCYLAVCMYVCMCVSYVHVYAVGTVPKVRYR